jgi:hypothetical protein
MRDVDIKTTYPNQITVKSTISFQSNSKLRILWIICDRVEENHDAKPKIVTSLVSLSQLRHDI